MRIVLDYKFLKKTDFLTIVEFTKIDLFIVSIVHRTKVAFLPDMMIIFYNIYKKVEFSF